MGRDRSERPHECCRNWRNMAPGHGPRGPISDGPGHGVTEHCTVCHARHVEMTVDPFHIGVEIKPLGYRR